MICQPSAANVKRQFRRMPETTIGLFAHATNNAVLARFQIARDRHLRRVFDHHHGGSRCPAEIAQAIVIIAVWPTRQQLLIHDPASFDFTDDFQSAGELCQIRGADRVAIRLRSARKLRSASTGSARTWPRLSSNSTNSLPRGRRVAACSSTTWRACSKLKIEAEVAVGGMQEMIRQTL